MPKYDRDPIFLLPILRNGQTAIIDAITAKLPAGYSAKVISGHRTPADQFELYKQGREFRNGSWVKVGATVTNIDGLTKLSQHNYLPCLAVDIGLFDAAGKYLGDSPHYKHVERGAKALGLDWGGNWTSFVDQPHIEVPVSMLFKSNKLRDSALQWQRYLQMAGTYTGALDGLFGKLSEDALEQSVGTRVRSIDAWRALDKKFGPLPNA